MHVEYDDFGEYVECLEDLQESGHQQAGGCYPAAENKVLVFAAGRRGVRCKWSSRTVNFLISTFGIFV